MAHPTAFDPKRFKQLEREGYEQIAPRYAAAAPAREALALACLRAAALAPGLRVLDLASGPGILAAGAATGVGERGLVVASDLAPGALAHCSADVSCAASDAEKLCFAAHSFDRVLCGLGLMFFPDAAGALAEMRRVLAPRGRLVVSVWGPPGEVPLVECALDCLRRVLPPSRAERPSVLRFGEPGTLAHLMRSAGFATSDLEGFALGAEFADAPGYWQAFLDLAGGAAAAIARLAPALQAALPHEVERELAPYACGAGYRMTSTVLIATAQAA